MMRIAADVLAPLIALFLDFIADAIGSRDDVVWWTYCIRRLRTRAIGDGSTERSDPDLHGREPRRTSHGFQGHCEAGG